jgi:hypothetical protein
MTPLRSSRPLTSHQFSDMSSTQVRTKADANIYPNNPEQRVLYDEQRVEKWVNEGTYKNRPITRAWLDEFCLAAIPGNPCPSNLTKEKLDRRAKEVTKRMLYRDPYPIDPGNAALQDHLSPWPACKVSYLHNTHTVLAGKARKRKLGPTSSSSM